MGYKVQNIFEALCEVVRKQLRAVFLLLSLQTQCMTVMFYDYQPSEISLVSRHIVAGCPLTDVGWDTLVEIHQLALTSAVMSCVPKMGTNDIMS